MFTEQKGFLNRQPLTGAKVPIGESLRCQLHRRGIDCQKVRKGERLVTLCKMCP